MSLPAAVRSRRGFTALLAAVVVVVLVGILLRGALAGSTSGSADPLIGRPAPALAGQTLSGQELRRHSWRGAVTVVNIWASWCGPCRDELPLIAAFAEQAPRGVRVVTIDTRDGPAAARSLLQEVGARGLLAVLDPDGRMAVDWGVTGVPETFLVDADGLIRARTRGGVTHEWLREQVSRWRPA